MHDYELYGFSLFETLLLKQGKAWRLDYHFKRLSRSAAFYGMTAPDWQGFVSLIQEHHDSSRDEVLRFTLLREGGRWADSPSRDVCHILKRPFSGAIPGPRRLITDPLSLCRRDEARKHKSGSRIAYQRGFEKAKAAQADDCIFMDEDRLLLETSTSNLFLLIEGEWLTPSLTLGILPGTMRDWLLEKGKVRSCELHQHQLHRCEAALVSNAVTGLLPVDRINRRKIATEASEALIDEVGPRDFQPIQLLS